MTRPAAEPAAARLCSPSHRVTGNRSRGRLLMTYVGPGCHIGAIALCAVSKRYPTMPAPVLLRKRFARGQYWTRVGRRRVAISQVFETIGGSLGDSNPCFRRERAMLMRYSIVLAALAPAAACSPAR